VKQQSKISVQVHEDEICWGGFLVDEDSFPLLALWEHTKKATARTDQEIVREAHEECRTIITSNGWDFVRRIQEYQSPPNNPECRDLWGLLVLPNRELVREKQLKAVRHGLNVPRLGTLGWPGVAVLNLYVHLTDEGRVDVRRFKRCPFCEHPQNGLKINDRWRKWYDSSPITGGRAHRSDTRPVSTHESGS
jgi:hypothetical protein